MIGVEELERRVCDSHELLGPRCRVCPLLCKVDRRVDVNGLCAIGRHAVFASYFPHFGEENCLRGWRGSGTIFFSGCNLRCVFCQNHDISWEVRCERATPERLAAMMLELQAIGCHDINWVDRPRRPSCGVRTGARARGGARTAPDARSSDHGLALGGAALWR